MPIIVFIVHWHNKYLSEVDMMCEDTKEYNGHTYSGVLLGACIDGYEQGIADYKASDEYVNTINVAFNQGVVVGKRDLMSEAIEKDIRAKVIEEYAEKAIAEFTKFDAEHGYPTLTDVKDIISDVAEQLKEKN